jgi:hypothetical protein
VAVNETFVAVHGSLVSLVVVPLALPIARLRPGRYLLSADVQDGTHAARATMRFSVN